MGPHAGPPHQPCPRHSARTARQTTRGERYAGFRTNGTTRGARAAREGNLSTAYATGGTSSRRRQIRMSPYCECSPKKFAQILSYVRNLTPVRNTSTSLLPTDLNARVALFGSRAMSTGGSVLDGRAATLSGGKLESTILLLTMES